MLAQEAQTNDDNEIKNMAALHFQYSTPSLSHIIAKIFWKCYRSFVFWLKSSTYQLYLQTSQFLPRLPAVYFVCFGWERDNISVPDSLCKPAQNRLNLLCLEADCFVLAYSCVKTSVYLLWTNLFASLLENTLGKVSCSLCMYSWSATTRKGLCCLQSWYSYHH